MSMDHNISFIIFYRETETDSTHVFRNAYGQLGILRAFIKHTPLFCPATAEFAKYAESLKLTDPKIISFH